MKNHKRIVFKIGSNVITAGGQGFNERLMAGIARNIAELNAESVLVSSGAISCGVEKLGWRPQTIAMKQAAASVGQSRLMSAYERLFSRYGIHVGQVLLTHEDMAHRKRFLNARNTLITLLQNKILPIINENDTVATEEIQFGDNDTLAGQVAHLVDASLLIILSDVDGLYTQNPRKDKTAERLSVVQDVTKEIEAMAGREGPAGGTGGMAAKVAAAKSAARFGITTIIVNGTSPNVIQRCFEGESLGTRFLPNATKQSSKKQWIADALKPKGTLILDAGAVEAILKKGKSLLPSGILSVEGAFSEGEALLCKTASGERIAKGLTNYNKSAMMQIAGKKSSQIETILGYKFADEVIHRDNMVLIHES